MGSGVAKQQAIASASRGSDFARPNSTESLEKGSEEYADPNAAGSEECFDIVCVPCNRDGATVEAFGYCFQCKEHLCGFCYKYHKRATLSRNHKLLDKDAMPSTQRLARSGRNRQQDQDQTSTSTTPTSDNSEQLTSTTTPTQHNERQYQGDEASTSNKKQQGQSEASATTTKPKCQGEIYVKTSSDEEKCRITGLTMISPGKLVLCDWKNDSIKLVNVKSKTPISQLSLTGAPWDITSTSCSQVAVTLPYRRQIQFINVTDKLSLSHTIQTDGKCRGICYHQNKMIVTYIYPVGKIEIMSMDGKVITYVEEDSTGDDVFSRAEYVQANSYCIYVSDLGNRQVIILNWKGKITGRISGLFRPRGLTLLHDGSLLVCDCVKHTVYRVSGYGTNKRAVLEDVRDSEAICVDDEGHKLYISNFDVDDDAEFNNNIIVYDI